MNIQIDTREKKDIIRGIVNYFEQEQIPHFFEKLDVGDYMDTENPTLVIDRKHNLSELAVNVSTVPQKEPDGRFKRDKQGRIMSDHARFIRELERARANGIRMIVLCEHGGKIKTLSDVANWKNPRLRTSPLAMSGKRLHQILLTLSKTYDVRFVFCDKKHTGQEIVRLLNDGNKAALREVNAERGRVYD